MSSAAGSQSKHDEISGAAVASRRLFPRHFEDGPNPPAGDEQKEDAQQADAGVLYRHALESIFAFSSLADLHSLMSVCKDWQSAVLSMAPRGFTVKLNDSLDEEKLAVLALSPLRRHVGALSEPEGIASWRTLSADEMELVASSLPHLSRLGIKLAANAAPVRFPPSMRSLTLDMSVYSDVPALQGVVNAIAQLQQLEALTLHFYRNRDTARGVSFAPLARIGSLTSLKLWFVQTTELHVEQLRSLHQLRKFDCSFSTISLSALLALPHQLQLTELEGINVATEEDSAALATLPSLTKLVTSGTALRHADFLQHLPALATLSLGFGVGGAVQIPNVVAALQTCTQLTELTLYGWGGFDFTSEQLASCLQRMPRLCSLVLLCCSNALRSLSFLAVGTLASTLTKLEICNGVKRIPLTELHRVHALQSLRTLRLDKQTFDADFNEFMLRLYTPPSRILPALQIFEYYRV